MVKFITGKMESKLGLKEVIELSTREYIIEKIKSLTEDKFEEVADFIEFVEAKKKRELEPAPERIEREKADPLSQVIGICEGPSDLAERHDKYVYGTR